MPVPPLRRIYPRLPGCPLAGRQENGCSPSAHRTQGRVMSVKPRRDSGTRQFPMLRDYPYYRQGNRPVMSAVFTLRSRNFLARLAVPLISSTCDFFKPGNGGRCPPCHLAVRTNSNSTSGPLLDDEPEPGQSQTKQTHGSQHLMASFATNALANWPQYAGAGVECLIDP